MSADVRGLLTGAMLRTAAGIRDVGETIFAYVEALAGQGGTVTDVDANGVDVHVHTKDVLTGQPIVAKLFAAAGILWRLPLDQDSLFVLKPGNADGPGIPLALHGDGGAAGRVPSWLSSTLAGIFLPEGFRLESTKDQVTLISNSGASGGNKASLTMAKDGSVTLKANDGAGAQATLSFDANGKLNVTTPSGQDMVFVPGGTMYCGDSSGTEPATKGTQATNRFATIESYINNAIANHTHAGVTVGAGTTGVSASLAFGITSPPSITASKVQVK